MKQMQNKMLYSVRIQPQYTGVSDLKSPESMLSHRASTSTYVFASQVVKTPEKKMTPLPYNKTGFSGKSPVAAATVAPSPETTFMLIDGSTKHYFAADDITYITYGFFFLSISFLHVFFTI